MRIGLLIGLGVLGYLFFANSTKRGEEILHITSPTFSPDNQSLLFAMNAEGRSDIYQLKLGTLRLSQLTNNGSLNKTPAYFHNGTRVVYASSWANRKADLYLMKNDGTEARNITNTTEFSEFNPSVAVNGERIYFVRSSMYSQKIQRAISNDVFSVDSDGQNIQRHTNRNCFYITVPSLSKDQKEFLVHLDCSPNENKWVIFNAEGLEHVMAEPKPVLDNNAIDNCDYCTSPKLSPGGQFISFVKPHYEPTYNGNGLWLMDINTGKARVIFFRPGLVVTDASFSNDGQQLVFIVDKDLHGLSDNLGIWISELDGKATHIFKSEIKGARHPWHYLKPVEER